MATGCGGAAMRYQAPQALCGLPVAFHTQETGFYGGLLVERCDITHCDVLRWLPVRAFMGALLA